MMLVSAWRDPAGAARWAPPAAGGRSRLMRRLQHYLSTAAAGGSAHRRRPLDDALQRAGASARHSRDRVARSAGVGIVFSMGRKTKSIMNAASNIDAGGQRCTA